MRYGAIEMNAIIIIITVVVVAVAVVVVIDINIYIKIIPTSVAFTLTLTSVQVDRNVVVYVRKAGDCTEEIIRHTNEELCGILLWRCVEWSRVLLRQC